MEGGNIMLISIIIPVYNAELYIEKCISSIVTQSNKNWELIIVNDGSTDSSGEICKKYSEVDTRIFYVEIENQGVSNARNVGTQYATGDWIMFVDSDDWIEDNTLDIITRNIESDIDICFFGFKEIRNNSFSIILNQNKKKYLGHEDFFDYQRWIYNQYLYINKYSVSSPWAKLYRNDFLVSNKIKFAESLKIGEDKIFNLNAFEVAKKGMYIDNALYNYRIDESSTMRQYRADAVEQIEKLLRCLENYMLNEKRQNKFINDYNIRLAMSIMYFIILDFCHKNNSKAYNLRKEDFNNVIKQNKYQNAIRIVPISTFPVKEKVLFMALKTQKFFLINLLCKLANS